MKQWLIYSFVESIGVIFMANAITGWGKVSNIREGLLIVACLVCFTLFGYIGTRYQLRIGMNKYALVFIGVNAVVCVLFILARHLVIGDLFS